MNAKAHMFVNHYSMSTGMIRSIVGFGAKYAGAYRDHEQAFFDRRYKPGDFIKTASNHSNA